MTNSKIIPKGLGAHIVSPISSVAPILPYFKWIAVPLLLPTQYWKRIKAINLPKWLIGVSTDINMSEAKTAMEELSCEGFIFTASGFWSHSNWYYSARKFQDVFRRELPKASLGLSVLESFDRYNILSAGASLRTTWKDLDFVCPYVNSSNTSITGGWSETLRGIQKTMKLFPNVPIVPMLSRPTRGKPSQEQWAGQIDEFNQAIKYMKTSGGLVLNITDAGFAYDKSPLLRLLKKINNSQEEMPPDALDQLWKEAKRRGWV